MRLEDIVTEIQVRGVRARRDEWSKLVEMEQQERLEGLRMVHQNPNMELEDVTVSDNRHFYNHEEKMMRHRHLRPHQMPSYKGAELPGPMSDRNMEVRLQMVLGDLEEEAKKHIEEECDRKGNQTDNLTKRQRDGFESLRKRLDEEVVVAMTDKSNNLNVDTKENYKEAMKSHIENDEVITKKQHDEREKVLNAHGKQMMRVLRVGESGGERSAKGCRDGMRTTDSKISHLRGLR